MSARKKETAAAEPVMVSERTIIGGKLGESEEKPRRAYTVNVVDSDQPLASPFEIAQIAVALASMKGESLPDIEGAIELLRTTALQAQHAKRPVSKPIPWKVVDYRDFGGSNQITPPKKYPATLAACWRALFGRRSTTKEREEAIARANKWLTQENAGIAMPVKDEDLFWRWAYSHVPFAPRFSDIYIFSDKHKKRRQRRNKTTKQFTTSAKDAEGRFKNQKKASH